MGNLIYLNLIKMEWEVTTPHAQFHLKHDNNVVSLGGKSMCVLLTYNGPDKSMLHWLGTESHCELRGFPVKGKLTIHMVHLAVSIFRTLYRDVKYIHLIDSSSFKCALNNGKLYPIVLRESNFLFHGKTYYEMNFGAVPETEDGLVTMDEFRRALSDPSKKPSSFNFIDPALSTQLTPLYETTNTWSEFFKSIQNKWGVQKCAVIYPWYRLALNEMAKKTLPEHWKFDITKLPLIHPKFKKLSKVGGAKTRKRRPNMYPMDDPWDGSYYTTLL